MKTKEVLLVSPDRKLLEHLPAALSRDSAPVTVKAFPRVVEALDQIVSRSFDALVCTVDGPDELATVIRLKKAKPELPIIMLTDSPDPLLRKLGEQMGASLVVKRGSDVAETGALLSAALQSKELTKQLRHRVAETGALVRDVRRLTTSHLELVGRALGLAAALDAGEFVTLLVEDDPAESLLVLRAIKKAGLPPFVRTVRSVDSAIDYLSGKGLYVDRRGHPLPSLIVSDLNLGPDTGLDLLSWVRTHSEFYSLGFVLYTSSERPQDLEEAQRLGANFYVAKSGQTDELVEIIRSVYVHAMRYKSGLEY